jgi:DnaA-homolog protein
MAALMPVSARQLTLALTLREESTFSNFYSGDNLAVVSHLQNFATAGNEPFIYLWGAPGSGRTHLLQACCHEIPASHGMYIDLADPGLQPAVFLDMEYFSLVCLDNIDAIVGQPNWELSLFNFYNRCRDQKARLLISGPTPPAQLSCNLADLCSRLSWGLILGLSPLSDDQKLIVLRTRAKQRGLPLSLESATFLLHHYSRNLSNLFSVLDILDTEALRAKNRLTIPFIKRILGKAP